MFNDLGHAKLKNLETFTFVYGYFQIEFRDRTTLYLRKSHDLYHDTNFEYAK